MISEDQVKNSARRDVLNTLANKLNKTEGVNYPVEYLRTLIRMDMATLVAAASVSRGEKKQARQFEPIDYHLSCSFNLESVFALIMEEVERAEDPIARYFDLKELAYQILKEKYHSHQDFLAAQIKAMQERDGIKR